MKTTIELVHAHLQTLGVGARVMTPDVAKMIDRDVDHTSTALSALKAVGIVIVVGKRSRLYIWEVRDLSIKYDFGTPHPRAEGGRRKKSNAIRHYHKISDFADEAARAESSVAPIIEEVAQEAATDPLEETVAILEELPSRLHTSLLAAAKSIRQARVTILAQFSNDELLEELKRRGRNGQQH